MPVWRCPHCGIPQPETARCWVCHRSTTSCGTCRHFRHGIAGGLGLCGLDIRHRAVGPTEVRPCWTATAEEADAEAAHTPPSVADHAGRPPDADQLGGRPTRTFVPVDEPASASLDPVTGPDASSVAKRSAEPRDAVRPERQDLPPATRLAATEPRWSLWGDPDA